MANIQEITKTIDEFSAEMHKFQSLIDYLESAKETVNKAKNAQKKSIEILDDKAQLIAKSYTNFEKLASNADHIGNVLGKVDFPTRLDKIEDTVKDTIKEITKIQNNTISELQNAKNELNKVDLKSYAQEINTSIDKALDENKVILEKISNFNIDKDLSTFKEILITQIKIELSSLKNLVESNNAIIDSLFTEMANLQSSLIKSITDQTTALSKTTSSLKEELENINIANKKLNSKSEETFKLLKSSSLQNLILQIIIIIGIIILIIIK